MPGAIRNYPGWHRLFDAALRAVTPVPWPARAGLWFRDSSAVVVDAHEVEVEAPLGAATALRIAFASDFHVGPTTPAETIDAAVTRLAEARADLLLLGGDFVSLRPDDARDLARRLAEVPAPLGRYAVLGNHDYWAGAERVVAHLDAAGLTLLTNRSVRLPAPFDGVVLSGLDDHTSGEPDAAAAFGEAAAVRIVLMHAPSGLLDLGERPFTVALCGHTHGGQVVLRGLRLVMPHGALSRRYAAGRYEPGSGRTLLVSRGVGCGLLPLRWNAPAAISICTLRSRAGAAPATSPSVVPIV
jgi:predicted MPP superfamily phosphohydrolase